MSFRLNRAFILFLTTILVITIAYGLWLVLDAVQPVEARQSPVVVETLPVSEALVSRATTVEFLFDHRMDHVAVEQALSISPSLAYDTEWIAEGTGERLVLHPHEPLDWQTTYRVTISEQARNIEERPLGSAATVEFKTAQQVEIVEVLPEPGAEAVDVAQPITIRFDRPMFELDTLEQQDELPQPVLISPQLQGIGQWLSEDTYSYFPDPGLNAGTRYEVAVSPVVAQGQELPERFSWSFETEGPTVEASFPFDGATEVANAAAIKLLFSQPMDQESVERNFRLTQEGSEDAVAGEFRWQDDGSLLFIPRETLQPATSYELQIDDQATAQNGVRGLASPYRAVFTTVDYLAVESVQPAPGSGEVSMEPDNSTIAVQFNHPVVALTGEASDEQRDLPVPIRFSPTIEGEGEWVTTSLFLFRPTQPLEPSTEYVVSVVDDLQDTVGSYLAEPYAWTFTTEFPRVLRVEPSNPRRTVPVEGPLSVRFNQPMEDTTSEEAFSLVGPDGAVAGRFAWQENQTVLEFTPDSPLLREQPYTLRVEEGARGRYGGETSEPFETTLVGAPELRITSTTPVGGSEQVEPWAPVVLSFTSPVNPEGIIDEITFEPEASVMDAQFDTETLSLSLFLEEGLQPSTTYTVTVGANVRGEDGESLGEPYSFSFSTAPLPPFMLLASQGAGNVATYTPYTTTYQLVNHLNVSRLDFSLHEATEDELLYYLGPESYEEWEQYTGNPATLVDSWSVELDTPENEAGFYPVRLPPEGRLDSGVYFLRVTAPEDIAPWSNRPIESKQMFVLTPVHLLMKQAPDEVLLWATDVQTGEPLPNLPVRLLNQERATMVEGLTDEEGLFRYERTEDETVAYAITTDAEGNVAGFTSTNFPFSPDFWAQNIPANFQPNKLYGTIYTDRPIYRPGQKVFYRGILRQRDGDALTLPTLQDLTLKIFRENGEFDASTVALSPYGTFFGEFTLAEDIQPGYYSIVLEQQELGWCYPDGSCSWETLFADFQVAEYERPEFEVLVESDPDGVIRGEPANATIQARYYTGSALTDAPIRWRTYSEGYHFRGPSLPGFWSWEDTDTPPFFWDFTRPSVSESGELTLDASGQASLSLDTTRTQDANGVSLGSHYLITEATGLDPNTQREISGRDEVLVHAGAFYIGLNPASFMGTVDKPFTINVATADTNGVLQGGHEIEVELYERVWSSERVERESFVWRRTYDDTFVASQEVTTGEDGRTTVSFTPEQGGTYSVLATGRDAYGNEVRSRLYFWVTESGAVTWEQDNDNWMELVADKKSYRVGEVARIIVPTPFEEMTALVTEEGFEIERTTVRTLDSTAEVLEIPITSDMVPNRFISVAAVKGITEETPLPEFRLGYLNLEVLPEERLLQVEILPQSGDALQPGDEATFDLQVTDHEGSPVEAELSLAVVDKAILALSEQRPDPLVDVFYSVRPLAVASGSSFLANLDRLLDGRNPFQGGGGGGGGPVPVREDLQDTAYWRADIVTDGDGRARVTFILPDNLTTWILTARAVTAGETMVGEAESALLSTIPLSVRPSLPRFLIVGDQVDLRVPVHNNSPSGLQSLVTVEVEGLALRDGADETQAVSVGAGQQAVVTFPLVAIEEGEAMLTFSVEGEGLGDTLVRRIPVYPPTTVDVKATSGVLREGEGAAVESIQGLANADQTRGELTVEFAPSLAGAAQETLEWFDAYPYESIEVVISRLLPNIATAQALEALHREGAEVSEGLTEEIATGINALQEGQNEDGGWGWWPGDGSNTWLTAYAMLALEEATNQGYEVPEAVATRAGAYLREWLTSTRTLQDNATLETRAFVLFVLSEQGDAPRNEVEDLFLVHTLLDTEGRAFLLMALDSLGGQEEKVDTLAAELTARARLSATGAHWEQADPRGETFESSLRTTAAALRALLRVQPEHMLVPQSVRWLMGAREAGHWRTTHESAWSLLALTDYMVESEELAADFSYEVALNDRIVLRERASSETLEDPVTLQVDVAELLADEANELIIARAPAENNQSGAGRLYYSAWLRTFQPTTEVEPQNAGIAVTRRYEAVDPATLTSTGAPVEEVAVGDLVQVHLRVDVPEALYFFTLEDFIPAGFEAVDPSLLTNELGIGGPQQVVGDEGVRADFGYDNWSESIIRDEKVALFSNQLPRGTYEYSYMLRAVSSGSYQALPAVAYESYHPERFGRSSGAILQVTEGER